MLAGFVVAIAASRKSLKGRIYEAEIVAPADA
jgi:hypothetical protein